MLRPNLARLEFPHTPIRMRLDVADVAAQQVHEGLTDLLREGHGTSDPNRIAQIRRTLGGLAVELAAVQDAIGDWADRAGDCAYGHGV